MIEIEMTPDELQLKTAAQIAAEEVFLDERPIDSTQAKHEAYLDISDSMTWVALINDTVRGLIAFRQMEHTQSARIDVLAADKLSRERKLRVGSALLEHFETEMRYRGIGYLTLESLPDATGFYEAHNYTKIGVGLEYAKWLD